MKRAGVGLIVAAVAASLVASQAAASGGGAVASRAPAVRIGGPHKLHARRILKFPIFVSADSFVKVRGRLRLPGPNLPVHLGGTIRQGHPKQVKLTLNGPAKRDLKDQLQGREPEDRGHRPQPGNRRQARRPQDLPLQALRRRPLRGAAPRRAPGARS